MGDEEGYICRWDPAGGRGAIRASRTPGIDLPFEAADLQLGPQAPRLGMAVVFQRTAAPAPPGGHASERAVAIRPWASAQGDLAAGSGRRTRRPVFQATGAAALTPLEDPLAVARTALTGREATPLNGITRPSPLPEAPMGGSSRPFFHPTPAWPGALALAAYGALLAAGTLRGRGPLVVAVVAPLLWLASFTAYWHDKHGARTRSTADRDATLHLIDALGGWPGGWLAMRLLPHKRQRPAFQLRFWVIAGLHSVALGIWLGLSRG